MRIKVRPPLRTRFNYWPSSPLVRAANLARISSYALPLHDTPPRNRDDRSARKPRPLSFLHRSNVTTGIDACLERRERERERKGSSNYSGILVSHSLIPYHFSYSILFGCLAYYFYSSLYLKDVEWIYSKFESKISRRLLFLPHLLCLTRF